MSKREKMHPLLRNLLMIDEKMTETFCYTCEKITFTRTLKNHSKMLEFSGNGILWLSSLLAFVWILDSAHLYSMQINLFMALLLDVFFVALIKAAVKRRRPSGNKNDTLFIGPDLFSFPSGHASRASMITYFFLNLWPVNFLFVLPLLAWSFSISLSRIVSRRHHLLDVAAGILLGIAEGIIVGILWLSDDTSAWFVSFLTDDKRDGGEYHV